eukprot:SAG11_NODE_31149_length_294_cov_0.800000_1_plen_97_part_11
MMGPTIFEGPLTVPKLGTTEEANNVLLLGADEDFTLCSSCDTDVSSIYATTKGAGMTLRGQTSAGPDEGGGADGGDLILQPGSADAGSSESASAEDG